MSRAYRFVTPTRSSSERQFLECLEEVAGKSKTSYVEKFRAFSLWAPRQDVARFLLQYDIYSRHVLGSHGSVIECGVCFGGGLMAWSHFASILEPYNHTRRVIGFDTFEGFVGMSEKDDGAQSGLAEKGAMAAPLKEEIEEIAALHDWNRPIGHIPRVELIKGDATKTIPKFVQENKHLIVSLLVLDFDVYQPTRVALEQFVPLMNRGSVIVFDELNCKDWPGETQAVMEFFGEKSIEIKRMPFASTTSYAIL